jgi:hypothetical protein
MGQVSMGASSGESRWDKTTTRSPQESRPRQQTGAPTGSPPPEFSMDPGVLSGLPTLNPPGKELPPVSQSPATKTKPDATLQPQGDKAPEGKEPSPASGMPVPKADKTSSKGAGRPTAMAQKREQTPKAKTTDGKTTETKQPPPASEEANSTPAQGPKPANDEGKALTEKPDKSTNPTEGQKEEPKSEETDKPPEKPAEKQLSLFDKIRNKINQMKPSPPDDQQKVAFNKIKDMLALDKLGGKDGRFNSADVPDVTKALLKDKDVQKQIADGIKQEGDKQVKAAPGGMLGRLIASGVRNVKMYNNAEQYKAQGEQVASEKIAKELTDGMSQAGVRPDSDAPQENTPRNLTLKDMEAFKEAAKTAEEYSKQTGEKTGMTSTFPNGVSREDIDAILEGRIPPGGILQRYKKP